MPRRKFYFFLPIFFFFTLLTSGYSQEKSKLLFFYSQSCAKCQPIKEKLLPSVEKEFRARIQVEYCDIAEIENYKLLLKLQEKYRPQIQSVLPVLYLEGHFLDGAGKITRKNLRQMILYALSHPQEGRAAAAEVDLISYFKTLRPLAIVSAGLADGINPCAFSVIVFFLSFLALQGYSKREILSIGLSFIFAVFLTYVLLGLGLFGFLFRLRRFWLLSRTVNLGVGFLSIILGILALWDFFQFKKTQASTTLVLQLPAAVKRQIQKIIGWHYRSYGQERQSDRKRHIFTLLSSALLCGFLISLLEAVCTGQVYLPTIAFILRTTTLKVSALGYLLLYNLFFITPLLAIFSFSLLGSSSSEFSRFLRRHLGSIKLLLAAVFFGLGIFLVWRP